MLMGGNKLSILPNEKPCEANDYLLCFHADRVLFCLPEQTPPILLALTQVLPKAAKPVHLLSFGGRQVYALDTGEALPVLNGLSYQPVTIFRTLPSEEDSLLLITAWHLITWYRRNRYCGGCGYALTRSKTERALCCAACGQIIYPTISPAVSVAVTDQDRLLLARNARATFAHFSLVAGYAEVGETLEETVVREVMEEVGLKIRSIRYVGSQAWGLSQSEMVGFHAELDGDDTITLQESELSEARWFYRHELQPNPNPLSLSFEMIERFRRGEL